MPEISFISFHNMCCVFQGSDFVHRSVLQKEDSYLTHIYEDARTMYESFIRGARVSSKSDEEELKALIWDMPFDPQHSFHLGLSSADLNVKSLDYFILQF